MNILLIYDSAYGNTSKVTALFYVANSADEAICQIY